MNKSDQVVSSLKGESMKQKILPNYVTITIKSVVALMICAPLTTHSVRQIIGNNLTTSTFVQTINCSVFHRPTQSFYVGLSVPPTTTAPAAPTTPAPLPPGAYSIARATPLYDGHVPAFTPLCNTAPTTPAPTSTYASALAGMAITDIALMSSTTNPNNPLIACLTTTPPTLATTISVLNSTGTQYAVSNSLNDSSGTAGATGTIFQIAASEQHIFAALQGNGAAAPANGGTNFGSNVGDGVALTGVTLGSTGLNFTYHNVNDGTTTTPIAAAVSTTVIGATAPLVPFGFNLIDAGRILAPPLLQNFNGNILDMHYDSTLQKLYVTAHMTTSTLVGGVAAAGNIVCGLVIFDYDPIGDTITLIPQYDNATAALADNDRIIGAIRTGGVAIPAGDAYTVLEKVSVLHTSTGYPYLIVVGGTDANPVYLPNNVTPVPNTQSRTRNRVYALPLIAPASQQGVAALVAGTYVGQLAVGPNGGAGELGTSITTLATGANLALKTDTSAIVGDGALPFINNSATNGVTWMECVGDTVFVSIAISNNPSATDTGGIFYSQAQFNNFGKIVRWSEWAKAAPFALSGGTTDGSVQAFGVSAVTGAVWGVEVGGQNVYRTDWTETGYSPVVTTALGLPLVSALNTTFSNGCFSVFDLNQSIGAFGNQTTYRYALFGGMNQVAFALISISAATGHFAVQNNITSDFSLPANYMVTQLPLGAGPIRVLGYSGGNISAANTQGFFFAGTQNGLYVWAANGGGIGANNTTLGNLNTGALSPLAYSWQKVPVIVGEVVSFKTRSSEYGEAMYVVTKDTSSQSTLGDRLYRISQASTAGALAPVLIATSGTVGLSAATQFYDCEVLTIVGGNTEQVVLATNNGLYRSATVGGVQGAANQAAVLWTLVTSPTTAGLIFNVLNVSGCIARPTNLIASNWLDNSLFEQVYDRSALHQICFDDLITTTAELPANDFISDTSLPTSLSRITYYWSDGARRFHIALKDRLDYSTSAFNTLLLLPYRTSILEWNTANEIMSSLRFSITKQYNYFYWVHSIGAGGQIMVGTDTGVISLE